MFGSDEHTHVAETLVVASCMSMSPPLMRRCGSFFANKTHTGGTQAEDYHPENGMILRLVRTGSDIIRSVSFPSLSCLSHTH